MQRIEGTANTPKVVLDTDQRYLLLEGESRPEDVRTFYAPILEWLDTELFNSLIDEEGVTVTAEFKMDYFNSASSKYILDILEKLNEIETQHNVELVINWYYEEPDEDMKEAGEEFAMLTEMDINFKVLE